MKSLLIICLSMFIVMPYASAKMALNSQMAVSSDEYANHTQKKPGLSTGYRINNNKKRGQGGISTGLRVNNNIAISQPEEILQAPRLFKGETVLPAVFAYHCNNHDMDIKNCGEHTVPYGNNLQTDVHFTHSWFQINNTSGHTFTSEDSELYIEVYGQNGLLTDVIGGPDWYDDGKINLLHPDLAGIDGFRPRESIFFYFGTWMNDNEDDVNPPYSAKLIGVSKKVSSTDLILTIHVGWEEIIEDNDGQRYAKAGTLIDKEKVILKPSLRVIQQPDEDLLRLFQ